MSAPKPGGVRYAKEVVKALVRVAIQERLWAVTYQGDAVLVAKHDGAKVAFLQAAKMVAVCYRLDRGGRK